MATIKDVRTEGVYIVRDSGSGCISPRCWGNGEARKAALTRIRPGDMLEVQVASWNPRCDVVSLILPGFAPCGKKVKPTCRDKGLVREHKSKPDFRPIPSGSLLAVDTANVFGKVGPAHAARVLESIASALDRDGYRTLFFIERRALAWLIHNQDTEAERDALKDFCRRSDVSLVGDEADLPILQTLEVEEGSYAISMDSFSDYAREFPEIVGTKGRIRKFSFARVGDRLNISIDGVRHMVVVDMHYETDKVDEAPVTPVNPIVADVGDDSDGTTHDEQPQGKPTPMVHIGKMSSAIRYLGKVARKDPAGYFALAELFGAGAHDGKADPKKAARYEKLGRKFSKRIREMAKRYNRLNAMRIKDGGGRHPHMSKRLIRNMRMAEFGRGHEEIVGYFRLRRKGLRHVA